MLLSGRGWTTEQSLFNSGLQSAGPGAPEHPIQFGLRIKRPEREADHIHLLPMCETTHPRHHRYALDKALRNLTNFHNAAAWMCDWLEHWQLAAD